MITNMVLTSSLPVAFHHDNRSRNTRWRVTSLWTLELDDTLLLSGCFLAKMRHCVYKDLHSPAMNVESNHTNTKMEYKVESNLHLNVVVEKSTRDEMLLIRMGTGRR